MSKSRGNNLRDALTNSSASWYKGPAANVIPTQSRRTPSAAACFIIVAAGILAGYLIERMA